MLHARMGKSPVGGIIHAVIIKKSKKKPKRRYLRFFKSTRLLAIVNFNKSSRLFVEFNLTCRLQALAPCNLIEKPFVSPRRNNLEIVTDDDDEIIDESKRSSSKGIRDLTWKTLSI
jgi:hypothetical protein